jgi:hypothetical protein
MHFPTCRRPVTSLKEKSATFIDLGLFSVYSGVFVANKDTKRFINY